MAREFQSETDFEEFTKALRKQFWESTLKGELDEHLGYEKHETRGHGTGNSRNGKTPKRIRNEHGELEIDAPRDRNGSFAPKAIAKRQTRTRGIDDKILYRPLDLLYPILYLDCIVLKIRHNQRVINNRYIWRWARTQAVAGPVAVCNGRCQVLAVSANGA